jgi:hypothetical protein
MRGSSGVRSSAGSARIISIFLSIAHQFDTTITRLSCLFEYIKDACIMIIVVYSMVNTSRVRAAVLMTQNRLSYPPTREIMDATTERFAAQIL